MHQEKPSLFLVKTRQNQDRQKEARARSIRGIHLARAYREAYLNDECTIEQKNTIFDKYGTNNILFQKFKFLIDV